VLRRHRRALPPSGSHHGHRHRATSVGAGREPATAHQLLSQVVKRGRLILALTILLLIVLPLSLVGYVALTPRGLQLAVSHVPKRMGSTGLSISTPRGTLASGFEVDRIVVDHERCLVIVEGIKGRLSVLSLLWQTLDARDVSIRNATVQLRRRTR